MYPDFFLTSNIFFPDTASDFMHPVYSAANADIFVMCDRGNF